MPGVRLMPGDTSTAYGDEGVSTMPDTTRVAADDATIADAMHQRLDRSVEGRAATPRGMLIEHLADKARQQEETASRLSEARDRVAQYERSLRTGTIAITAMREAIDLLDEDAR